MVGYSVDLLSERLRALALPEGSYAVFGSGPMAVRGLIADVGDLDVIVSAAAWDRVRDAGEIVMYSDHETVDLGNGLTFGRSWAYGDFDIAQLIEDAELINGVPFVRLQAVIEYKRLAARPKDRAHIDLLKRAGLI